MPFAPDDLGPVYAETLRYDEATGGPIVEPWNTASNLVFLVLVVYWWHRLRGAGDRLRPLRIGNLILLIGFIGGIVYHATRSHAFWLFMDFGPIVLLTMAAAYYFWLRVLGRPLVALAVFSGIALVLGMGFQAVQARSPDTGSLSYVLLSLNIIAPVGVDLVRNRGRHVGWLVGGLLTIVVALGFREYDHQLAASGLPMGSHFLWHLLGGLSAAFLFQYVFRLAAIPPATADNSRI